MTTSPSNQVEYPLPREQVFEALDQMVGKRVQLALYGSDLVWARIDGTLRGPEQTNRRDEDGRDLGEECWNYYTVEDGNDSAAVIAACEIRDGRWERRTGALEARSDLTPYGGVSIEVIA